MSVLRCAGWRTLMGLPERDWSSAAELHRAVERVAQLLEPHHYQPNFTDQFLDLLFSLVHVSSKRVYRALFERIPPDNGKIRIVLLGNGFLRPGRIVRGGVLAAPALRNRARELFGAANRALGFDLFTFHTQFSAERDPCFVEELLAEGRTTREWVQRAAELYPPDRPDLHFSLMPMTVLGLLEAVLLLEPFLKHERLREAEFLPVSSGILAAAHFAANLPFEELCGYVCNTLAPLTLAHERRMTRQYLESECGVPAELLNGRSPGGDPLCTGLGPGMLVVVGFPSALILPALEQFHKQTGAPVELALRMGAIVHVLSGLKPHLAACMEFLKRERRRHPLRCLNPVRYRLLPVFHGSHHSSYRPVREQARPALKALLLRHPPPERLHYAISHAHPRERLCYRDRETLAEEMLDIIDRPVDMLEGYQRGLRAGDRRFVFASCAAGDFSVRIIKKNILDAQCGRHKPHFLDLNQPAAVLNSPPLEFSRERDFFQPGPEDAIQKNI